MSEHFKIGDYLRHWWAFGLLAALVLACFGRLVAHPGALLVDGQRASIDTWQRGRGIGNDLTRLFLPLHLRIGAAIHRDGHLPGWDPFGFGGRALVGNPQAGLWYPPVWVAWWSGAPAALGWLTVAHLIWGGLGTYRLVRGLGVGRWGAVVAGGCFEAAPYLLAQAFEGHLPHLWAACWYPWAFAAALRARRGDWRGVPELALVLALALVAGHPQEGYYLVVALGLWAVGEAFLALRRGGWGSGRAHLGGFTVALALALGLAGVEWLPAANLRAWALHGEKLTLKNASHYHPDPLSFLQLLSPRALGGPAEYFGPFNYWETLLSFGWVPLVLAAAALRHSPRRVAVRGWGALALFAVVFACGKRLGLFWLCYLLVPGMGQFRVPARALYLASLGVAVLAGLGAEAILEGARADWRTSLTRYRRWVFLILLGIGVGQGFSWSSGKDHVAGGLVRKEAEWKRAVMAASRLAHDPVFWLALSGTTLGMVWLAHRPTQRRRVALGLGMLALVELGAHGFALIRTAPAGEFLGPDPVSAAIARLAPRGPFRIRARDAFYDDLRAVRYGFEKTNINDLFQFQHAADLYECLYGAFGPAPPPLRFGSEAAQTFEPPSPAQVQGVLDRMNVALLVADQPVPGAPWPVTAAGSWRGAPFTIYANPSALPRAYVVPRVEVAAEGPQTLARFATVDAREAVLLPSDPLNARGPRQAFTPASYRTTDPDRVEVEVTTQHPGLLVVSDTWLPGWIAWVDGRKAAILRGNHAQRVVPLPQPGKHFVVMRFQAPGLSAGLALTGVSGCFLVLAWVAGAMLSRRPQGKTVVWSAPAPHFRRERHEITTDDEYAAQPTGVVSGSDESEQ
jgi:hypothetical protein